jgi:hypothetical protein
MTKFNELISAERNQYKVLVALLIGVVGMTGVLNYSNSFPFHRFIGRITPLLAMLFIAILGFLLLSFLLSKGWFSIYKKKSLKGIFRFSWLLVFFASIAILLDWKINFPKDINIPFPESLLFYPSIAFLVEIIFHILPLSVLLFFLTSIFKNIDYNKIIWVSILVVAMLEPTYQIIFMDSFPTWAMFIVWFNLFLFNVIQLFIFKKYDFISMFSFRILYYAIWHIIWGYFRLQLLF